MCGVFERSVLSSCEVCVCGVYRWLSFFFNRYSLFLSRLLCLSVCASLSLVVSVSIYVSLSLPLSSRHTDYKVASPALRAVGNIVTGDDIQTQVSCLSHTGFTVSPAGRDGRRLY